jgi:PHD/YefM family antitoxin component YafN of YafNO toxin-antitoxin module
MNILSANELKRYGVTAIERQLKHGPVHVLKHNQPLFVVLSEDDYQLLVKQEAKKPSGLFALLSKPVTGKKPRKVLDQRIAQERAW